MSLVLPVLSLEPDFFSPKFRNKVSNWCQCSLFFYKFS